MAESEMKKILAYKFAETHKETVKKICEPLKMFGIDFFYERLFIDNSFLVLAENDSYKYRFYISIPTQHFRDQAFLASENQYTPFLWPESPGGNPSLNLLFHHNIWNAISFFKRNKDYVEIWNFTTNRTNERIREFYIKHKEILEQFILYFNEKTIFLRENRELNQINLENNHIKKLSDDLFFNLKFFKKKILLKKYSFETQEGIKILSKRHIECLHFLSQGETAKEVARSLNLSPRTIEGYINTIKQRLGKNRKSELIEIFLKNKKHII